MHSAGLYHSPDLYAKLIEALGRQQQWEKALELFLSMQVCTLIHA
jgi:pentatricopeptide repeat protein